MKFVRAHPKYRDEEQLPATYRFVLVEFGVPRWMVDVSGFDFMNSRLLRARAGFIVNCKSEDLSVWTAG